MANISDYFGGGGGGPADTFTASTAVAGISVKNGRSYALSSEGKMFPDDMLVEKQSSFPVPNSVIGASGYEYAFPIFGDCITPDGKATFHFIADNGAGYYGKFYISLDGGITENGPLFTSSTGNPFDVDVGWGGAATANMVLKLLGEETDYWFYIMYVNFIRASGGATNWYNIGRGFMVKKADHKLHTTESIHFSGAQSPIWASQSNTSSNRYDIDHDLGRQSKNFFFTCRNKDIFVWTTGAYNMPQYGFIVNAVDTYRSSDSNYWGGTAMGLPKTSGANTSDNTHRDNVTAQQHLPLFKVDDTNGIFIAPYYCASGTNNGQHVFLKYTIGADHSVTTSSEVLIGGTDPAQGGGAQGHWIATSNPLIFFYLYHDSSQSLYYTKCTWNADWTAATWGTQAQLVLPIAMTDGYGTQWALDYDSAYIQMKHSIPESELFFMVGKNEASNSSAVAFSFPATGTPSVLGTTTLNNELNGVKYSTCYMQSLFDGQMLSIQNPSAVETYGRAVYYTEHYNPAFKKTSSLPAIARADGDAGSTVNIDLKSGDTATTTLSSDFYLTKEGMSYAYDVDNADLGKTGVKSVQRGYVSSTASSFIVGISAVNVDKSVLNFSSNRDYSGTFQAGVHPRGTISGPNSIQFNRGGTSTTVYVAWEVIEYV